MQMNILSSFPSNGKEYSLLDLGFTVIMYCRTWSLKSSEILRTLGVAALLTDDQPFKTQKDNKNGHKQVRV